MIIEPSIEKKKSILLFVPAQIDIKHLMRVNGYSQTQINAHLDKYHYFLHLIHMGYQYRYDIDNNNGYTKLTDDYLKPFLQGYRHQIKKDLKNWGVVITDNQYITGKKSKGYKIAPEYAQSYRTEICINDVSARPTPSFKAV